MSKSFWEMPKEWGLEVEKKDQLKKWDAKSRGFLKVVKFPILYTDLMEDAHANKMD